MQSKTHNTCHPGRSGAETRDLYTAQDHPALRAPLLSGSAGRRGVCGSVVLQRVAEGADHVPLGGGGFRRMERDMPISCVAVRGELPRWEGEIAPQEYSFATLTAPRQSLCFFLAMTCSKDSSPCHCEERRALTTILLTACHLERSICAQQMRRRKISAVPGTPCRTPDTFRRPA